MFHTSKMADINKIIKELWQKTYRGQVRLRQVASRVEARQRGVGSHARSRAPPAPVSGCASRSPRRLACARVASCDSHRSLAPDHRDLTSLPGRRTLTTSRSRPTPRAPARARTTTGAPARSCRQVPSALCDPDGYRPCMGSRSRFHACAQHLRHAVTAFVARSVVMYSGAAELEMRGRCSAGQKVQGRPATAPPSHPGWSSLMSVPVTHAWRRA